MHFHSWIKETPKHRICRKCGSTETRRATWSSYWYFTPFEIWERNVTDYHKQQEHSKISELKSRELGLEYVKKLEGENKHEV